MAWVTLLCISFAGGIVWLFNVEATAVLYAGVGGHNPLLVGLTCAVGQSLAYTFLFFSGGWLLERWSWGRRQIERTRARYGAWLERSFLALTAPAALIGLPPMTAMAALAGGFHVRFLPMIGIAFSLRLVRLLALAFAGTEIAAWWRTLW